MNFREEAVELVKQVLAAYANEDFDAAVTIIEDYITDMDTMYKGAIGIV